jgi:protease PrsW
MQQLPQQLKNCWLTGTTMIIQLSLLLVGAIAPIGIVLFWTWWRDRLPEPPRVVLVTFVLGALVTLPILLCERLVSSMLGIEVPPTNLLHALLLSFLVAALVEETFKFLVLTRYSATHSAFDEPYDGIVYGVAASLGFACVENVLYVIGAGTFGLGLGLFVACMRALLAVPLHTCCGAIMGVCIGVARFKGGASRLRWNLLGFACAILLHGLYDTFVFGTQVVAKDSNGVLALLGLAGTLGTTVVGLGLAAAGAAWLRKHQRAPMTTSSPA